mgnify:CR=1 FL=1
MQDVNLRRLVVSVVPVLRLGGGIMDAPIFLMHPSSLPLDFPWESVESTC